jgi:hypothetical protein
VTDVAAQKHLIITEKGDTLAGRIMEVEKKYVVFTDESNETSKIPHSEIKKAIKSGLSYPVINGRLSLFPFVDSEKAGLYELVEVPGKSAAQLFQQALDVVNMSSREFSRQADGSTVAATYSLLGVKSANTQVVDLMFKNDIPLKYSDANSQTLIVKIVNRYEGGGFGCVRIVWWEYDLKLKFKDGRYKIEVVNFKYSHFSNANTAIKVQFYGMEDGSDCGSYGNIENLLRCQPCMNEFREMYSYLIGDSRILMQYIRKEIKKNALKKDDDW